VQAARELAARHGVMMPIVDSVARVLFERVTPQQAIHDLLAREARGEA
jgi:glycerol-3-phosphate dehydrogenase (NAD(P)+)